MKRVGYTSKLNINLSDTSYSSEILKIVNNSRKKNKSLGITGVVLFSGVTIFQFLEGNAEEIAKLIHKISRDPRHRDFSIVLNCKGDECLFPDWSMRLISAGTAFQKEVINKIHQHCDITFDLTSTLTIKSPSHSNYSKNPTAERASPKKQTPTKNYQHTIKSSAFQLKAWPRSTQVELTRDITRLCSALSTGPKTLDNLRANAYFSNEATLLKNITLLDNLKLLTYASQAIMNVHTKPIANHQNKDEGMKSRFSQALKRFVGSVKMNA